MRSKNGNETPEQELSCSGCVDEFAPLHDELGIANCGTCIRNKTITDNYQRGDNYSRNDNIRC